MCKCVLPPGVNPIAVGKYININIIRYENLKLLKRNYLAQKWIFCLISLLGHIVLVTELIARLGT
jgi:hypothetical protein